MESSRARFYDRIDRRPHIVTVDGKEEDHGKGRQGLQRQAGDDIGVSLARNGLYVFNRESGLRVR